MKKILIFIAVALISCTTQKEMAKMWEGYTKDELVSVIGEPCITYRDSTGLLIVYNYQRKWYDLGGRRYIQFTLDTSGVITKGEIIKLK
jgi:hypothetical protein